MSRQPPVQQAPPVMRLRIRYAKRGRLRFTSHRDFSRAFERAIFRARVPMAYSSGFNPHPRISYAGAAPTGSASEAEYLEIALAHEVDPDFVRAALSESLPDGLDIMEVVVSPGGGLADRLEASRWIISLATSLEETTDCAAVFWARDTVTVERMTKKGLRKFDCRPSVVSLACVAGPEGYGCLLDLVLRHQVPSVRPDDVLRGIVETTGLQVSGSPVLTRLAQGPLGDSGDVGDPLVLGQ